MRWIALVLLLAGALLGCASAPEPSDATGRPPEPVTDTAAADEATEDEQPTAADEPDAPAPSPEISSSAATAPDELDTPELPAPPELFTRPDPPVQPYSHERDDLPRPPETAAPELSPGRLSGKSVTPSRELRTTILPEPSEPIALTVLEALQEVDDATAFGPESDAPTHPEAHTEAEAVAEAETEADPGSDVDAEALAEQERGAQPDATPAPGEDSPKVDTQDSPRVRPPQTSPPQTTTTPRHPEETSRAAEREPQVLPAQQHAVGEEFSVELPGSGWVYLGTEDGTRSVEFVRRDAADEHTVFVFRVREPGEFRLRFQRQDMARGEIEDHRLRITASEDPEPDDSEPDLDRDDIARVPLEDDESEEDRQAAVDSEDDRGDDSSDAGSTDGGGEDESLAPDELLARARQASENDAIGDAIRMYEEYLRAGGGGDRAHAHFMLGRLYERPSDYRNLKRSREHYTTVVNEYPVTRYYTPSRQRVRYLDRYFFEIR